MRGPTYTLWKRDIRNEWMYNEWRQLATELTWYRLLGVVRFWRLQHSSNTQYKVTSP